MSANAAAQATDGQESVSRSEDADQGQGPQQPFSQPKQVEMESRVSCCISRSEDSNEDQGFEQPFSHPKQVEVEIWRVGVPKEDL